MQSHDVERSTCLVLFQPVPESLQNVCRTLGSAIDVTDNSRALELLGSIETAAQEERLCLEERQNVLTGARGLIIAEGWEVQDPEVTHPLAELLTGGSKESYAVAHNRFEWLGLAAFWQELSVVIHASGSDESRSAFVASIKSVDDKLNIEYLARLLLSEGEISQWSAQ